MSDPLRRDDAESRLADIRAAQERLIGRVTIPAWYWWAVAVSTVILGLVVDRGGRVEVAIAAVVFALAVAAATGWVILGGGRVQVGRRMLGGDGAVRIVGFVGGVVGVSLVVGFSLRAAGFAYPATLATLVAAAGVVGGGPLLMRGLRRVMLRQGVAR
jgi:hypothetical protein